MHNLQLRKLYDCNLGIEKLFDKPRNALQSKPKQLKYDVHPRDTIFFFWVKLFESSSMTQPEKKQKFIRKEWARFRAYIDSLPQNWFLIAGYILVAIGFCAAVYEFIWLGMLGG